MLRLLLTVVMLLSFASVARAQIDYPGCAVHAPTTSCEDLDEWSGADWENTRLFVNGLEDRLNTIEGQDLGDDGIIDTGKVTSTKILDATVALIDLATESKLVTNLASACLNVEVLGGTTGGTGVQCQTDDDRPEAADGDFVDAASLSGTGLIDVPYVATMAGDANIVVTGAGTVGRPVTLALGTPVTLDAEAHAKVLVSATTNAMVKVDASGVASASGIICDGQNNCTIPGMITIGTGSGAGCFQLRDHDDQGNTDVRTINGAFVTTIDTNGICDGI